MIKGKEKGTWTKKDNSKNKDEKGRKEREKETYIGKRKGKSNKKELTYQINEMQNWIQNQFDLLQNSRGK